MKKATERTRQTLSLPVLLAVILMVVSASKAEAQDYDYVVSVTPYLENANGDLIESDECGTAEVTYSDNKTGTLTATPADGYHFKKWVVTSGGAMTINDIYSEITTFNFIGDNYYVQAIFVQGNSANCISVPEEGGWIVRDGTKVFVTANEDGGYYVKRVTWSEQNPNQDPNLNNGVVSPPTLLNDPIVAPGKKPYYLLAGEGGYITATFGQWTDNVRVTFNNNGHGTAPAAQDLTFDAQGKVTVPKPDGPTDDDWLFCGWYKDQSGTEPFDFGTPLTKDGLRYDTDKDRYELTLYAKWTEKITGACGEYDKITNTFADNVTYTLTKSPGSDTYDILTIGGSGILVGIYNSTSPWYDYCEQIKTVIIGDGVTGIGNQAFDELTNVETDITIPASVKSIGVFSFHKVAQNMTGGISITAAEGSALTEVSSDAFTLTNAAIDLSRCTLLTAIDDEIVFISTRDVTLPSSLTAIAQCAFGRYAGECFSGDYAYITVPAGKVLSVGDDKGVITDNGKADLISYLFDDPANRSESNALSLGMSDLSDWQEETRSVTLERTFPAGKRQTVCLPFAPTELQNHGKVWQFTGIEDGKAVMTEIKSPATLSANTPYIFEAESEVTSITFSGVTIDIGTDPKTEDATAGFTFHGTYEQKTWEADDPVITGNGTTKRIYGFMMKDNEGREAGQFAKAIRRTVLRPFSCWLEYDGNLTGADTEQQESQAAPRAGTRGGSDGLPDVIEIVWVGGDGTPGTTGLMDTRTGEVYVDDAWYGTDGTRLSGRPDRTGLYINEGRQVYITVE